MSPEFTVKFKEERKEKTYCFRAVWSKNVILRIYFLLYISCLMYECM